MVSFVDRESSGWWVCGNYIFSREITFPFLQNSKRPMGKPAFPATFVTKRWWWNFNFFVKLIVFFRNLKILFAMFANWHAFRVSSASDYNIFYFRASIFLCSWFFLSNWLN